MVATLASYGHLSACLPGLHQLYRKDGVAASTIYWPLGLIRSPGTWWVADQGLPRCTDQSEGQRPAGSGRRVDDLAASPVEQELYIPVMVVQPDDTVTIACKLAACPKQTEVQVCANMCSPYGCFLPSNTL